MTWNEDSSAQIQKNVKNEARLPCVARNQQQLPQVQS